MSKIINSGKHMSADSADKFEEQLEGSGFGDIGDWEFELGEKILKIEKLLATATKTNTTVVNMMTRKLLKYNVALQFLEGNPKAAATIGSSGGLRSVMGYLEKQATEDAARAETQHYSNQLMKHLPGVKLNEAVKSALISKSAASASAMSSGSS